MPLSAIIAIINMANNSHTQTEKSHIVCPPQKKKKKKKKLTCSYRAEQNHAPSQLFLLCHCQQVTSICYEEVCQNTSCSIKIGEETNHSQKTRSMLTLKRFRSLCACPCELSVLKLTVFMAVLITFHCLFVSSLFLFLFLIPTHCLFPDLTICLTADWLTHSHKQSLHHLLSHYTLTHSVTDFTDSLSYSFISYRGT